MFEERRAECEMKDNRRIVMMRARTPRRAGARGGSSGCTGGYAERFEKGSPDTPPDYLIVLSNDMSRSFDAFSYLYSGV